MFILVGPIVILWHEFAHALFALAVTRSPVTVIVGFGPSAMLPLGRVRLRVGPLPLGGVCIYDGSISRGDHAIVAAAGPIASAFLAALAWNLRAESQLLGDVAVMSAFGAVLTALPIRYPRSFFPGGSDSDGLTVLRALFPAAGKLAIPAPQIESRPQRPLRAPFAIVLGLVGVLAFAVNFWLGLWGVALFGFAYLGERR